MKYTTFFKTLRESEFFKTNINRYKTIGVFLIGSRGLNIDNVYSNYDILCIIDEEEYEEQESSTWIYNDDEVSWFYCSYNDFVNQLNLESPWAITSRIQLGLAPQDYQIYQNEEYNEYNYWLFMNRKKLVKPYIKILYNRLKDTLIFPILKGELTQVYYKTKLLSHLYFCVQFLTHQPVDADFMFRLKEVKYVSLTNSDRELIYSKLKILVELLS